MLLVFQGVCSLGVSSKAFRQDLFISLSWMPVGTVAEESSHNRSRVSLRVCKVFQPLRQPAGIL